MLRTLEADELAVVEFFLEQEHQADQLRAPYLDDQEMLLSFYMNQRQQPLPQGLEWMSGDLLADSFLLTEAIVPTVAQGVLGGKSVSVNAYTLAGSEVNKAMDKGLYRLRRKADFEFGSVPSMRMASVLGHSIQKNVWVEKWGKKLIPIMSNPRVNSFGEQLPAKIIDHEVREIKTYAGPKTFYPDNAKVWKSAATDMLGKPLVWIEEVALDLDYMLQVNDEYEKEYGEPFYRHLKELRYEHKSQLATAMNSTGNAGFNFAMRRRTATEQASWMGRMTHEGHNSVTMRWGYARIPEHVRDYRDQPQERLVVYTPDGLVLRDVPMPTWNMEAPFHDIKFMQVANEPYGRSPLYWCLPEIERRSELRNLRLAEAWMNIFQTRIANRNANWDHNDFGIVPGGVWMYDSPDDIRPTDVIMSMPRQPVLPEIYREDAVAEDHINRVYGSTPNMQGEGLGSRASASEAQLVDLRAGGRTDLIARQLAHQYELPSSTDYLGMFAAFSEEPLEVQIDGEEKSFPVQILAEEIDFDYDVVINAGEYGVMNNQSLAALRETLGLVFQHPDIIYEIDPREAVSAWQHRTGQDNILRPQAEAAQRRQQAMQMAQMQMLSSGAGGGQS